MPIGVQLGYKGHFEQIKNPASVDLQGIKKAAPTGFEFVWNHFVIIHSFYESFYYQRFQP